MDARFACEHGCAESHVSQSTKNESVSLRTISLMVAGGPDRVQSMPANTVAKYVISSFGIVNNQREKQTTLQVVQKIPIFWKAIGRRVIELPNAYELNNP